MTAASRLAATGLRRHQRRSRLGRADRPGADRLAGEIAPQVVGELPRGGVAAGGGLGHRLEADRLQVARDLVVEVARRPGLVLEHLEEEHPPVAAERALAGQQLVEDDAEAVDVAAGVDPPRLAPRLLGAACRRACPGPGPSWVIDGVVGLALGQAEVHQVRPALVVEQDVRGLDVAVDHARGGGRSPGRRPTAATSSAAWRGGSGPPARRARERRPLDELLDQVERAVLGLPGLVQRARCRGAASCAALRASRRNRVDVVRRRPGLPARGILMATIRPSSVSRARNTWPNEPAPSRSSSSNLPRRRGLILGREPVRPRVGSGRTGPPR